MRGGWAVPEGIGASVGVGIHNGSLPSHGSGQDSARMAFVSVLFPHLRAASRQRCFVEAVCMTRM